jgi:hypothetical protein
MPDRDAGVKSQTVIGHSASVSFDEALKDAISRLETPPPEPHTDLFTMGIRLDEITVDLGGITNLPGNLTVTITAKRKKPT